MLRIFGDRVLAQPVGIWWQWEEGIPQKTRRQDGLGCWERGRTLHGRGSNPKRTTKKEGLQAVWQNLKAEHCALCRAERFCWNRRRTQKVRERFFREPVQFGRGLFEQPLWGALKVGKEELENHLEESISDALKNISLSKINSLANPRKPTLNAKQPAWHEVETVVRKALCTSTSGPNGELYTVPKL